MSLESWALSDGEPNVKVNGNFVALEALRVYGQRNSAHDGLTWGYHGGPYGAAEVSDGTLTLAASATNYIVAPVAGGAPTVSTGTTNWNNSTSFRRVYAVTTDASGPTAVVDHRTRDGGLFGPGSPGLGGSGDVVGPASSVDNTLPRYDGTTGKLLQGSGVVLSDTDALAGYIGNVNAQTGTSYTVVVSGATTDAGKIIDHSNGTAIAVTLPNSAPVGFAVTYVQGGAGVITFASTGSGAVVNRQNHTKTAGVNAMVALYVRANAGGSAAVWVLGGDTAA
ncbi:MAG: hypothetical protein ACRCYZ_06830 [Alphaproteobacteria bacterium]